MKKSLLVLLSILCLCSVAQTQKKDKSGGFEEPMGWCKLVQLKNGNTCLLEFTKKEGIHSVLYDTLRKKIAGSSAKLPTTLIADKLGYHIISGIYEINGDVVVFFQKAEDRTPVMIRLIIDGKTGKLKSEEKIAELEKMTMKDAYAMAFGGMDVPDIRIVKDPESDYYAMIRYNTTAPETKDRIEVFHFNPEHKVINKANYTSPNNKYKYTRYLNAYVHKHEYVVIGTYAFNTDKSGGDDARFYISQLSKGKTTFQQKELEFTKYWKKVRAEFVYNPVKNLIHMIIVTGVDVVSSTTEHRTETNAVGVTRTSSEVKSAEIELQLYFQNFKPGTLSLEKPFGPDFTKLNEYYRSNLGNKDDFHGSIQGTFVDKKGDLVLMYQRTTVKMNNGAIVGTFLEDVALLSMSAEGKTVNGAVFPYYSYTSGDHSEFNANKIRSGFRPANNFDDKGLANEQYFSIDFVSTDKANYLLFNNLPKNVEAGEADKIKLVKAIGATTAVKYTYGGGQLKRDYLFKKPKEKNDVEFCLFAASSYNPAKKTYATIFTDPEKKKSAIVWIKLD